jgi:serine/threonine-protein kinase
MRVLSLAPILPLFSGMVFLGKAGILSGAFYAQAAACFITAALMALEPRWGLTLLGIVLSTCFIVPGLKYRRRQSGRRAASRAGD